MNLSANEVIDLLDLEPHPTCGLTKLTYLSSIMINDASPTNSLKYPRIAGSVLYFMVTKGIKTKIHKILSDQMYHFYLGSPLEVLLIHPNGDVKISILGQDIKAGMTPQLLIPSNTFHVSKIYGDGEFALLGTSEWVGVKPEDFTIANNTEIINQYPQHKELLQRFI